MIIITNMSRSIMLNLEERKNIKRHNTICKKILTKLVQNYHNTKDKTYFLIAIDNIICFIYCLSKILDKVIVI